MSIELLIVAFLAGLLTVLSPCVFPLLPVVLTGSAQGKSMRKAIVVILSLLVSIFIFSMILKAITTFIFIPNSVWTTISGLVLIVFSLFMIFPKLWDYISNKLKLVNSSQTALNKAASRSGIGGEILLGASLGPVFSSCSPTYLLILAAIFPVDFITGTAALIVYCLGLGTILLLIAFVGNRLISSLNWAVNPEGWFKKILGFILLIVGLMIITGVDKQLEAAFVRADFFNLLEFEQELVEQVK